MVLIVGNTGAGIFLGNGGTVANFGTVTGVAGRYSGRDLRAGAAAVMVSNSGMIAGGISLRHGGNKTITNIGTISSTGNGAFIWYGTDLITNSGRISASDDGVYFRLWSGRHHWSTPARSRGQLGSPAISTRLR